MLYIIDLKPLHYIYLTPEMILIIYLSNICLC